MMNAIVDFGKKIISSERWHMVAILAMYVLLAVEYYRFVYLNYCYIMGFDFRWSPVAVLVGFLFLAILVYVLFGIPLKDDGSYAVSMIVAVLFCLPSIVMYQIGRITVFVPVYTLLFVVLLRTPLLEIRRWPLPRIPVRWQRLVLPVVCLICLLPFPIAYGFHIDLSLFSLGEETYKVREAISAKDNLLTSYLMGPLRMVLLPMLIVYGMTDFRKNWWMAIMGIAGMLFLFLLNPQKSIFFSVAVVLAFFFFREYKAKAGVFLCLMLAVCLLAVALNVVTGNLMVESILLRRLLFVPAMLSDSYFVFFDRHPMLLSHSFLSHWFDNPYSMSPANLMGKMLFNLTTSSCNTGIVGDGFMNFGHIGAVMFVAIGALIIRFIDSQVNHARFFGLLVLLVITFLNSALFTTMLTHGGLVLIVAGCFFIPEKEREEC